MQLVGDAGRYVMLPHEVAAVEQRRWHRALTVSLGVHALILAMVLQHQLPTLRQVPLTPLSVLLPPLASEPVAPPPVEIAPAPAPLAKHARTARHVAAAPEILRAPATTAAVAAPSQPNSPSLPAAEATPAPPVVQAAPAPAPVAALAPRPVANAPDPGALAGFNRALAAAVDRHKRYPRIALIRQWQGTVILKLDIGADGRLRDYRLARSSNYEALDQQALEMLREAMPLPAMPAQLAGIGLSVDIPVTFRITD